MARFVRVAAAVLVFAVLSAAGVHGSTRLPDKKVYSFTTRHLLSRAPGQEYCSSSYNYCDSGTSSVTSKCGAVHVCLHHPLISLPLPGCCQNYECQPSDSRAWRGSFVGLRLSYPPPPPWLIPAAWCAHPPASDPRPGLYSSKPTHPHPRLLTAALPRLPALSWVPYSVACVCLRVLLAAWRFSAATTGGRGTSMVQHGRGGAGNLTMAVCAGGR